MSSSWVYAIIYHHRRLYFRLRFNFRPTPVMPNIRCQTTEWTSTMCPIDCARLVFSSRVQVFVCSNSNRQTSSHYISIFAIDINPSTLFRINFISIHPIIAVNASKTIPSSFSLYVLNRIRRMSNDENIFLSHSLIPTDQSRSIPVQCETYCFINSGQSCSEMAKWWSIIKYLTAIEVYMPPLTGQFIHHTYDITLRTLLPLSILIQTSLSPSNIHVVVIQCKYSTTTRSTRRTFNYAKYKILKLLHLSASKLLPMTQRLCTQCIGGRCFIHNMIAVKWTNWHKF